MKRFTYRDRRNHGHSPFWAWFITASSHPIFNVILLGGLFVLLILSFVGLFS